MLFLNLPASVGDAGGGVACLGFCEDVVNGHVSDLLLDNADIFLVCHYPHVLHWADWLQSINCQLNKGTSHAHHINELLGVVGGRHWPEAAAYAACHNYYLYVVEFIHRISFVVIPVLTAPFILYCMTCIQRHHHHKEHTEVKKQSILSYPLVVI